MMQKRQFVCVLAIGASISAATAFAGPIWKFGRKKKVKEKQEVPVSEYKKLTGRDSLTVVHRGGGIWNNP